MGDLIEHGQLRQPLKPNTIRINDNFIQLFQNVIGITRDKKPTLVWSAAETVVAPELAVRQLHVENIAGVYGMSVSDVGGSISMGLPHCKPASVV